LIGLWLIATQHCGLEAAGWLDSQSQDAALTCCSNKGTCTHDGCGQVERNSLPNSSATLKVSAPALHACSCALCLLLSVPVLATEPTNIGFAARLEESVGWLPTWHFARRAAQPPRAPSLNLA